MNIGYADTLFMEITEDFREKFVYVVERYEKLVSDLENKDRYVESVNEFFRHFHTLKTLCQYLSFDHMIGLVEAMEDLFGILRDKQPPIRQSIIDWLWQIHDVLKLWQVDIENDNFDITPIDSYTLNMLKISIISSPKADNILKDFNVLVFEQNINIRNAIQKVLKQNVKALSISTTSKDFVTYFKKEQPNFIIIGSKMSGIDTFEYIKSIKKKYNIPILVLGDFADLNIHNKEMLEKNQDVLDNVTFFRIIAQDGSLNIKGFDNKMRQLGRLFFDEKDIMVTDANLIKIVKTLKALPQTVVAIQQASRNQDFSLRDLSNIIINDPILSAKLLKIINSPLYSLKTPVNSVSQAITLLGKERTVSIALQIGISDVMDINLHPYGMTIDEFYKISKRRMELMIAWYSKVSFKDVPMLATSALLGNIGQIVIAKVVSQKGYTDTFHHIVNHGGDKIAEAEVLNTLAEDVSADMLTYWGLEGDLVDSIRYSFDLANASNDVKPFAIANYVVYNTIKSNSSAIDFSAVTNMSEFIKELNLKPEFYLKAIEKIS
jgi:HD-like signal output (HDOD) protein